MGDIATKYGFYGPGSGLETGAESLKVIDGDEGFEFEIMASDEMGTSALWVAQRVRDDEATVTGNMFAIREVDFEDTHFFLGTPLDKMLEFAQKANITVVYGPNGKFDWAGTFSPGEYAHKYYSGRRMWRALSLFAPSLDLKPEYDDPIKSRPYPFSVKPERKLTPFDLMAIHRDWYG